MTEHSERYWEARWRDEKAITDALAKALDIFLLPGRLTEEKLAVAWTARNMADGTIPVTAAEEECLVYSVPEAGKLLGLSKNAAYLAAKRGDIPTLKIGTLRRVPKTALHAMLVPTPEQTK